MFIPDNVINDNEEITLEEGNVNAVLFLYDDAYIELLKRAAFADKLDITAKEAIKGENDCFATAYLEYQPSGKLYLMLSFDDQKGNNYFDDNIPISDKEKEDLRNGLINTLTTRQQAALNLNDNELFVEDGAITGKVDLDYSDQLMLVERAIVCSEPNEELAKWAVEYDNSDDDLRAYFKLDAESNLRIDLQYEDNLLPLSCEIPLTEGERGGLLFALDNRAKEEGKTISDLLLQARGEDVTELVFGEMTKVAVSNDAITATCQVTTQESVYELMKRSSALRDTAFTLDDVKGIEPSDIGYLEVRITPDAVETTFYLDDEAVDYAQSGYEVLDLPLMPKECETIKDGIQTALLSRPETERTTATAILNGKPKTVEKTAERD